jgi:hypothetical protein
MPGRPQIRLPRFGTEDFDKERAVTATTPAATAAPPVATTLALEPMTRVGGALGVHASTDGRAITDARVAGTYFRGYETVIDDRDPRDCMALASRACGWCGGVHQTTASIALEMARWRGGCGRRRWPRRCARWRRPRR